MEHEAQFMRDGMVMLGFALVFVTFFRKLGLGATLGYIVAGALVGPQVLGLIGNADEMIGFAEIGIILLLFIVGLELDPARLWRMRKEIFGFGLAQVAACGLAVAAVIFFIAGYPFASAVALGLPLGLSSTAQVLPMLQSGGKLGTPFGERAFSILLFQDLSIIILITIVAALSLTPEAAEAPPGWQLALMSVAAVGALIAAGRFLLRPLFRLMGNLGEREMFVVAGLFVVTAAAGLMEALGLSAALGAFVAGVMLADTPYRHELEADIEPFRSILLGLFFLSVGMMLDLNVVTEHPVFVVTMALGLIATKAAVIYGIARIAGMAPRSALALGLLLSQGGEFGFVLFAQAEAGRLIDPDTASLFGAVVTLSMVTTPFLMMANRRLRSTPEDKGEREGPSSKGEGVIVIGYGRFGQTVAQMLIASDVPVTLIDLDTELIDTAEEFGAKVYFGDGKRIDLLRQAGANDAAALVFCIDGDQLSREFLNSVNEAFPQAKIFARAFDRRTIVRLADAPVELFVREMMGSALYMAEGVLAGLGHDEDRIAAVRSDYRERDVDRLEQQKQSGDIKAARDQIITEPPGR